MERPTIETTLEDSGARVILYDKFTYGDFNLIQEKVLEGINIDLSNPEVKNVSNLSGKSALEMNKLSMRLLIKEVFINEEKVNDIDTFIYNLSITDGGFLTKKVEEIGQRSNLTPTAKKK